MWVCSPGLSALPAELPGRSRGGTRTRDLSIKRGNRRAFDPCRLQELRTRPVEPGAGTDMGSDHGDVSIFKGVITHGRSTRTDPRPCGPGDRIESPRPGPQTLTHTPQGCGEYSARVLDPLDVRHALDGAVPDAGGPAARAEGLGVPLALLLVGLLGQQLDVALAPEHQVPRASLVPAHVHGVAGGPLLARSAGQLHARL